MGTGALGKTVWLSWCGGGECRAAGRVSEGKQRPEEETGCQGKAQENLSLTEVGQAVVSYEAGGSEVHAVIRQDWGNGQQRQLMQAPEQG